MKGDPLDLIHKKILASGSLAITSHLRPDGDSICTCLALAFMAEDLGKKVAIINKDRTPFPFSTFPDMEKIKIGQIYPKKFDAIILLECADVSRSGQKNLDDYFKINIDHHYSNYFYADINWVNPQASAIGEMALLLAQKLNIRLTPQIANHLYCAIASDTGSFQFSNTSAQSFKACYELVCAGADPIKISESLYNNNLPEKIKLLGQVLSTLEMNKKGNIAVITMFKKHLKSYHFTEIDTEDITTLARSIKGVDLVLFFKEMDKDTFRISIRSKGYANAAKIAEHFGGGGHKHAAGFTAYGDYRKLVKEIPKNVERLLIKINEWSDPHQ